MKNESIKNIISKKKIKEANGINTDMEQVSILSEFANMCADMEIEDTCSAELQRYLDKYPVRSPLPIVICKEHLPLYFELYNTMKENFDAASEKGILDDKFIRSFEIFEEFFVCHYGENLLKCGNWNKEEVLENISMSDIPEYDSNEDTFKRLQLLFSLFEKANMNLETILNEYNKGKCMYFYPVVHSILSQISYTIN